MTPPSRLSCLLALLLLLFAARPLPSRDAPARKDLAAVIEKLVKEDYPSLETLYKHFHSHPELSFEEEQTAARLAKELRAAGVEVTTGVGGHGVVGVLANGKGPTVLIRADMDALPLAERTGLAYASKVRARTRDGLEVGVMHACGHDMNIT